MSRQSLKSVLRMIDIANHELPVEQAFLADLKRSIELTAEKNKRMPSQTYKPSSMNCIRGMYYQIKGVEPKDNQTYNSINICNSGSDIHQRIQQSVIDMKDNGFDCEYVKVSDYVRSRGLDDHLEIVKEPDFEHGDYETKLYDKTLNMSFLCDGIIRYKGQYYILEIKTEASFKFNGRGDTDPKHFNQGTAYSLEFGIDNVIFVYVNRDILDMKSYMFHADQDMRQTLVDRINEVDSYVQQDKVPPKPDMPAKACTYCAYKWRCTND